MPKKFIGPYQTGLQLNLEPWLINEEAFVDLFNAYVYRGRIRKKQGIQLIDRLHYTAATLPDALGNTVAPHTTFTGTAAAGNRPLAPNTITITAGALTFTDNGHGILNEITAAPIAHWGTIDYLTGVVNLFFNPGFGAPTAVAITAAETLSRQPVMGIATREQDAINQEQTIAFDPDRAYEYNQGTNLFRNVSFYKMAIAARNPVTWHGADYDFFWSCNWWTVATRKIFWATNNNWGDHSRALTNIVAGALPTDIQITVGAGHPFIVGDIVYLDEITVDNTYNGLSGPVTAFAANTIDVTVTPGLFGASTGYVFALTRDGVYLGDGIKFYDGPTGNFGWRNFQPPLQMYSATVLHPTYLTGCLCILPYKDRLLAFNTFEAQARGAEINYPNRVRWSQNGTPFYATAATAAPAGQPRAGTQWCGDVIGKGGYIDAPTSQAIVSVSEHRDGLIVFFERSTWLLRYTNNELLPFVWVKINEEQGAESTFSKIFFDNEVLAVGDKGLIRANSIQVQRIDEKIPDWVFDIHNADGPKRVHGIRDFQKKMCFWTYPLPRDVSGAVQNTLYPTRVLAWNYESNAFSTYNNFFTCFGYLQRNTDILWSSEDVTWEDNVLWAAYKFQAEYPHIVAGNQKGFIHYFDMDDVVNEESMDANTSGANLWTIRNTNYPRVQVDNHDLQDGQFIRIKDTTAFPVNVVAEACGIAGLGTTVFDGTLVETGLFPSTIQITVIPWIFNDLGNGVLIDTTGAHVGTIDYLTGEFRVNFAALGAATPVTANYTHNWINNQIFKIDNCTDGFFDIIDDNPLHDYTIPAFVAYTGFVTIEVVDNFIIKSKNLNPFLQEDLEIRLNYFNAYLSTSNMTFTVNAYGDDDSTQPIDTEIAGTADYYGQDSDKTWNRIYPDVTSSFLQLEFTMNDSQLLDFDNINNLFELHALILDIDKAGRLK